MDNKQLEQLIKVLELDQIKDWETIQVLWILRNNMSWRSDLFGVQGFKGYMPVNLIKDDITGTGDPIVEYYDLGESEYWGYLAMWLKTIVFNPGVLDLSIHSTTIWNYGDEGGPGVVIALLDKDNNKEVFDELFNGDGMCGDKFAPTIANGLGIQNAKKVYYLHTFTM